MTFVLFNQPGSSYARTLTNHIEDGDRSHVRHHHVTPVDPLESYLANEETIRERAVCDEPSARLVYVGEREEPGVHVPDCAFLHRCADDTGCCPYRETCAPLEQQSVAIYLLNIETGELDRFVFTNHTRCECKHAEDFER